MNDIKKLKAIIAALASLAAILAIVFFFVWRDRQSMIEDLTLDKEELTQELVSLQGEYSVLSSDNDSLNVQLDREREKVDQLLERIQKTEFEKIEFKFTNPELAYKKIQENEDYLGIRSVASCYNSDGYCKNNGVIMVIKK